MIKIIEKGKKEFITRCSRCGCKFSYELSDLQFFGVTTEGVCCPTCEVRIYHKEIKEEVSDRLE